MRKFNKMEFRKYIYLLLMVTIIMLLVLLSFSRQLRIAQKLKYYFPAVIFTGTIFVIWSMRFHQLGIWGVNPNFITGKFLLAIPVEEWLFLCAISYFPLIVYEWSKQKFRRFGNPNLFLGLSLFLLLIFGLLAWFPREKLYTFFTFFLLFIYFGYTVFRNRFKIHFTNFYITFFIASVPFFILKSILISLPAVSYNYTHTIGFSISNVPVEDFGYFFLLVLMNLTIYEYLKQRQFY